MAEALVLLSAIQASSQLVEQTFAIFSHIKRAYKRQRELVVVIERHEDELNSVETVLDVLKNETDLQTASIATELGRLKAVQDRLDRLLTKLDPKPRGKVAQFTHQLIKGDMYEKKLHTIMDDLGHVKTSILLCIQVANVGVIRNMEKQLVADAVKIERIDSRLREALEDYDGLRIAQLLKGRRPSNDGFVPLSPADLQSLGDGSHDDDSSRETLVDDDLEADTKTMSVKTERIIMRNLAHHQAIQINAALGEDIWKELGRLEIADNIAEDQAIQVNYGMSLEAFAFLADRQAKTIHMRRDSAHDYTKATNR